MRNLPIALVNVGNEPRMIRDSFFNAIITHGHPRAILGTILFSLAVNYALTASNDTSDASLEALVEYLHSGMEQIGRAIAHDERVTAWMRNWDKDNYSEGFPFRLSFNKTRQEASQYLKGIREYMNTDPKTYYTFVGALNSATKGSGLATVCAAIFLFLKYLDQPEEALTQR
jgi:ADP-ribosylglycohydrolase